MSCIKKEFLRKESFKKFRLSILNQKNDVFNGIRFLDARESPHSEECGFQDSRHNNLFSSSKPGFIDININKGIENFEILRTSKFSKKNFDEISFGNCNHSKFSIDGNGLKGGLRK